MLPLTEATLVPHPCAMRVCYVEVYSHVWAPVRTVEQKRILLLQGTLPGPQACSSCKAHCLGPKHAPPARHTAWAPGMLCNAPACRTILVKGHGFMAWREKSDNRVMMKACLKVECVCAFAHGLTLALGALNRGCFPSHMALYSGRRVCNKQMSLRHRLLWERLRYRGTEVQGSACVHEVWDNIGVQSHAHI